MHNVIHNINMKLTAKHKEHVSLCQIYACYSNSPAIYCLSPLVIVIDASLCFVATSAHRKLTWREWPSGWCIGVDS